MPFGFHLRRPTPDRTADLPAPEGSDWIARERLPFDAYAVGSLVPVRFEGYARVFHPALSRSGEPVRWEAVARWSGRRMHALAQWEFVSRPAGVGESESPVLADPPRHGLPDRDLAVVSRLLATHTTTPERTFWAWWEGYGGVSATSGPWTGRLRLDRRAFVVAEAPVRERPHLEPIDEAPTLIWPADRAWFVACDPDLDSTYVGGTDELIQAVLDEPALEAWPVQPDDRVSIDSDSVNAPSRAS